MRVYALEPDWDDVWKQWARHWIERLRAALGGRYATDESEHFHFLSEQSPDARAKSLAFLENARHKILRILGKVGEAKIYGKHLVIRFTDTDDYYAYVAHFYPDGSFAGSAGMFINEEYPHIAIPESHLPGIERGTLAHELSHNVLAHLPLPCWLNEALAMAFELDIGGMAADPLTQELAAQHRDYWDAEIIQEFWSGKAFGDVKGQEFAYGLARILLHLIRTEIQPTEEDFRDFVLRAEWSDGGAVASREHLGNELENLAATFLGEGDWAPRPKEWKNQKINPPDFTGSSALDECAQPPDAELRKKHSPIR